MAFGAPTDPYGSRETSRRAPGVPGSPAGGFAERGYIQVIPTAWRALAALCYLSGFLAIPLIFPCVVWMLYPRSRFLRGHALVAGLIQGVGLVITATLRVPALVFLIEENQFFMTPEQYAGALFSADQLGTVMLLVLLTVAFITFVILPGIASGQADLNRRRGLRPLGLRPSGLRVTGDELMLAALLAAVLTPLLFYMQGIWGPMAGGGFAPVDGGEGSAAGGESFFGLHLRYFEDPYRLFPGHVVLLWSMTGLILAVRGRLHYFGVARGLFIRFQRDSRAQSPARRYQAARWRALALPGWGQFFAGQRLSGLGSMAVLFVLALFWILSASFVYGRAVEGTPGLNENLAWNILGDLGLRAHLVSDAELRALFDGWPVLLGLSLCIALLVWHSRFAVRLIFEASPNSDRPAIGAGRDRWQFWPTVSHSLLLHIIPVAALLLIPVTLLPIIPPSEAQPPTGIPREFEELNEDLAALNGSAGSTGEESESEGHRNPARRTSTPVEVVPLPPQPFTDADAPGVEARPVEVRPESKPEDAEAEAAPQAVSEERELLSNAEPKDEEAPLKGKRKKQTYSNYLSVKIRAPEREFRYWDRLPRPYSAVFEYRITAKGEVHSVRIAEASDYDAADRLTVRLIESMGTVLPPPGEKAVVVTELFWNTGPADPELPTPLQQELSREFDGRRIEVMNSGN